MGDACGKSTLRNLTKSDGFQIMWGLPPEASLLDVPRSIVKERTAPVLLIWRPRMDRELSPKKKLSLGIYSIMLTWCQQKWADLAGRKVMSFMTQGPAPALSVGGSSIRRSHGAPVDWTWLVYYGGLQCARQCSDQGHIGSILSVTTCANRRTFTLIGTRSRPNSGLSL